LLLISSTGGATAKIDMEYLSAQDVIKGFDEMMNQPAPVLEHEVGSTFARERAFSFTLDLAGG